MVRQSLPVLTAGSMLSYRAMAQQMLKDWVQGKKN